MMLCIKANVVIFAFVIAALVALTCNAQTETNSSTQTDDLAKASIVRVLAHQKESAEPLKAKGLKGARLQRAWKAYAAAIETIDFKGCPKDFRLAWFDYVQACHKPLGPDLIAGVEVLVAAHTRSKELADHAASKLDNSAAVCWTRVKRLAVAYDAL
jgi:hypothetical protein